MSEDKAPEVSISLTERLFATLSENVAKKLTIKGLDAIGEHLTSADENKNAILEKNEVESVAGKIKAIKDKVVGILPDFQKVLDKKAEENLEYLKNNPKITRITGTTGHTFDREGYAAFLNALKKDDASYNVSSSDVKLQATPVSTTTDLGKER